MAENGKIDMAALDAMTLTELKALEKKVAKAISKYEEREKKKALAMLKEKAREMGFSLGELAAMDGKGPRASKSTGRKVAPKYANPADPTQTWTGRGRRPAWVVEALTAGKTLDDMTI